MSNSQIIIYQTENGQTKLDVRLEDETVWLTQKLMAELFQTTPQNITIHLRNIFEEGELSENATCKDFLQVQKEGGRMVERLQKLYNLKDWIEKLHGFLSLNDREILNHTGKISHELAIGFAENEFEKFRINAIAEKDKQSDDFEQTIKLIEQNLNRKNNIR